MKELNHLNGRDSIVVRASASRSGGRGFEPWPSHTKDFKNGAAFLSDARHSKMEKRSN